MTDLEQEIRDLLDDDARRSPAPHDAAGAIRRTRRRQRLTVAAASLTAAALLAGSILGAGALLRADTSDRIGGDVAGPRTSTITGGVTITYPADWVLVDAWPLSATIPVTRGTSGSGSDGAVVESSDVSVPTGLPLFQLSNVDLGLTPTCLSGAEIPGHAAVLYVGLDMDALRSPGPPSSDWPTQLDVPGPGRCGDGYHAVWLSSEGTPYLAYAAFGAEVSQGDRDELFAAFEGMRFGGAQFPASGPASPDPAYVVLSGMSPDRSWNVEARPGPLGVELLMSDPDDDSFGGSATDFLVPDQKDMEAAWVTAGQTSYEWGAVSDRVESVELRLDDGRVIEGEIAPLVSSLGAPFRAFVVTVQDATTGRLVGLASDGNELASEPFEPAATTEPSACAPIDAGQAGTPTPFFTQAEAEVALRKALVAAKTLFADCQSYVGATPEAMAATEPSLAYDDMPLASEGVISVRDHSDLTIVLVTRADGQILCIADDVESGTTTYGLIDAQSAAECTGGWADESPEGAIAHGRWGDTAWFLFDTGSAIYLQEGLTVLAVSERKPDPALSFGTYTFDSSSGLPQIIVFGVAAPDVVEVRVIRDGHGQAAQLIDLEAALSVYWLTYSPSALNGQVVALNEGGEVLQMIDIASGEAAASSAPSAR